MEEVEKINIINRKISSRPENWKWRTNGKIFGWGAYSRKNKKSKKGYENGTKESRREGRKLVKLIRHKLLFSIPLNEEELKSNAYREVIYENSCKS